MKRNISKVAVLGSGIMGSGIACHFANIGVEVLLLDICPSEINESEKLRSEAKVLLDSSQKKLDTAQSVKNEILEQAKKDSDRLIICLLYTSPSPRDS